MLGQGEHTSAGLSLLQSGRSNALRTALLSRNPWLCDHVSSAPKVPRAGEVTSTSEEFLLFFSTNSLLLLICLIKLIEICVFIRIMSDFASLASHSHKCINMEGEESERSLLALKMLIILLTRCLTLGNSFFFPGTVFICGCYLKAATRLEENSLVKFP